MSLLAVHLSGPYCKIRTAQGTNQNAPFRLGPVCHIIIYNIYLKSLDSQKVLDSRGSDNQDSTVILDRPASFHCQQEYKIDIISSFQIVYKMACRFKQRHL